MQETQKKRNSQEIDYLKIVKILFDRWYLIAGPVFICLLTANAYLWYTPKAHSTSGLLKFEEKKTELSDLVGSMVNSNRDMANLQSESFTIQSRNLLLNAIKDLDYRISFYLTGRIRTYDLYPKKPLQINLLKFDSLNFYRELITFKPVDKNTFELNWTNGKNEIQGNFKYNSPVNIGPVAFTIQYPGSINPNTTYSFKFNTPESFLDRVRNGLRISEVVKNSNILTLQQTDDNPQFSRDIVNAIMKEYLDYDRSQKTQWATQMISFINDQLKYLSTEVKGSERSLEKYKQNTRIMNVSSSAETALAKVSDLESQRSLLKIQLIAISQLKNQIAGEKNAVNINLNLEGSIDPLLGILVGNLNTLLNEKNALLKIYNNSAQPVGEINRQILQVKNAALQNINASNQRIQKNIEYLNNQLAKVNQQVSALPTAEKDLIGLNRDFEINEKVYSFLSEKSLEAQVNRSAILPGATIIEQAQVNTVPVSPNDGETYRTAIVLGLLAGLGIIVLLRVLNPYIYDREIIERITSTPILGAIRKFPDKIDENNTQVLALSKPRSIFAESIRIIRTNLSFLASEKKCKVICITSEAPGEGKSFAVINLASTLALIDKKVLLIDADLRRPKLQKTFGTDNNMGLSNYLVNQCDVDEIIQHLEYKNLHFISSGPVPPNPSELLHSDRMANLIKQLRERYEVILIDTAPVGLVSDSIPLMRLSDVNLFVIRYGKSKYNAATSPDRLAKEYHLNNLAIVLNAFEKNILHAGLYKNAGGHSSDPSYSYESSGYYIDEVEKLKWWKIKHWF
jgi:capsular exopolysaccharide synthesis family protein